MLDSCTHPTFHCPAESPRSIAPANAPLTFQQQWLLDLALRHEDWNCGSGYTFRLRGVLDLDLLRRSLEEVIRRHGSLRARIVSTDGITGQFIGEAHSYRLDVVSIPGTSQEEIAGNALRVAGGLYHLRADLFTGPLWTAKVLRLSACEHWLVLVMHRLIAECSSIERVFQELRSLYDEFNGRSPSTLPTPPAQYGDYAVWQQSTADDWVTRHEAYWSKRLEGAASVRLPIDLNASVAKSGAVGKMSCTFGDVLSMQLRDLARKLRVLSATIMLAVYAVALWRWSRQDDFVLPFNVAGRQSEHRPVVGYFSYILHLRVALAEHQTFREFLHEIGHEFYRALAHQDFGRIALQKPEFLASTVFQWVTWHPDDAARITAQTSVDRGVLTVDRVPIREFGEGLTIAPPGVVDVEITVFDASNGMCALGTYRADRFTARSMERFMEDLRCAAQTFVNDPDARVALS